jgi:hypothetical protein
MDCELRLGNMPNVSGAWSGRMVQPDGPRGGEGYSLMFQLAQTDSSVTGTSRIDIRQTSYYAVMKLAGRIQTNTLYFNEPEIIEQLSRPNNAWCLKRGALVLSPDGNRLAGSWATDVCPPGEIELFRNK